MSATAGLLVTALPAIAVAQNLSQAAPSQNNCNKTTLPKSGDNCVYTNIQGAYNTELSCRISPSSSQQNLETDSGKSSCSPALLDCSFDSGIVVVGGANGTLKGAEGGGVTEIPMVDKQAAGAASAAKTPKDVQSNDKGAVASSADVGGTVIGTGISCNAEAQMRQKLRYERLQQWRLILLELDRQRDPYRRLRERLSKICDRRISKKGSTNEKICNVCCCQIDQFDSKSVVTCCVCNKKICRGAKCSTWLPKVARWECQLCQSSKESLTHTQSWVAEQMSFNRHKYVYPMRARSEIYIPIGDCNESSMHFESVSQVGENSAAITAEQKLKIREYVEEVVANLLGGSLEQIRVGQLSRSENYLPGILNNSASPQPQATPALNGKQCNDSKNAIKKPSEFSEISQTRLRYMIESIIAETLQMPPLANGSASEVALNTHARSNGAIDKLPLENGNLRLRHRPRTDHYFEPKIYQDLLATAVLNKIADKEGNLRQLSESTPDLSSRNIDANFNVENQSTSSGSSVEPRSDFSYTDTEQPRKINKTFIGGRESALSDYIAGHTVPLPDLSAAVTESEEDDHASVSSSTLAEGTWEDNWLFRKKRTSLTTSMTGSVGMLVPAPKDDVRAQIGDKTTDEISDLSEMGSDTDDSSLKIATANLDQLNDRILNKHLIGGQNTKVVLDELIETASLISNTPNAPNEPEYHETRNEHVGVALKTEAINPSVANHTAKAAEVEQSPLSGSIAEREYKKWNNAVEMPNNPYAPEALKRRISGSQERFIDLPNISSSTEKLPISLVETTKAETDAVDDVDFKRYSRDYYINDDKSAKNSPKHQSITKDSSRSSASASVSDEPAIDITINEVNSNGKNTNKNISLNSEHSDCHWTLSTPVRRSSSLKFINRRAPPKSYYNYNTNSNSPLSLKYQLPSRPLTSISHYESLDRIHDIANLKYTNRQRPASLYDHIGSPDRYCYTDKDDCDNDDVRSQRSWRSASAAANYPATLPKRRALSSLSFQSSTSGGSSLNSASMSKTRTLPNANILSQFEKQLLHKDLKRNSFRAISATTKDFVMNPLYERESTGDSGAGRPNLSAKRNSDEQIDSGVDSCLNGFSEAEVKSSNTSLLF